MHMPQPEARTKRIEICVAVENVGSLRAIKGVGCVDSLANDAATDDAGPEVFSIRPDFHFRECEGVGESPAQ
jgi:hypothetical protein